MIVDLESKHEGFDGSCATTLKPPYKLTLKIRMCKSLGNKAGTPSYSIALSSIPGVGTVSILPVDLLDCEYSAILVRTSACNTSTNIAH